VWAQIGVIGPNSDQQASEIAISFSISGRNNSSFDIEIKGGDNLIRSTGPGTEYVTVTGNVATAIKVRLKSHSAGLRVSASIA